MKIILARRPLVQLFLGFFFLGFYFQGAEVFASETFPLEIIPAKVDPLAPKQEIYKFFGYGDGGIWSQASCKEESFDGMSVKCRKHPNFLFDMTTGIVILKGKRWYAFYDNLLDAQFSPDKKFLAVWNAVLQKDGKYSYQRKIVQLKDKKVTLLPFDRCTKNIVGWGKDRLITVSDESALVYGKDAKPTPGPLPEICVWDTKGTLLSRLLMNKYATATTPRVENQIGFVGKEEMMLYVLGDFEGKNNEQSGIPEDCEIVVIDLLNSKKRATLSFSPSLDTYACIITPEVDMSNFSFKSNNYRFRERVYQDVWGKSSVWGEWKNGQGR